MTATPDWAPWTVAAVVSAKARIEATRLMRGSRDLRVTLAEPVHGGERSEGPISGGVGEPPCDNDARRAFRSPTAGRSAQSAGFARAFSERLASDARGPARGRRAARNPSWGGRFGRGVKPPSEFYRRPFFSSLLSLYSIESTRACQEASMMLSATPTVPQVSSPSPEVTRTRVLAAVPLDSSRMRTL